MADHAIQKFLDNLAIQNAKSAETVSYYLKDLDAFSNSQLRLSVADLIKRIKEGVATDDPKEEQPYRILQQYAAWLKKNRIDTEKNNPRTVKLKLSWARTFVESNFIPISRTLYKQLVKSPKVTEPDLSPIDKKTVTTILTSLDNIRLMSYALFVASAGWRASESLAMKIENLENFNIDTLKFTGVPYINSSGKHAKTKVGKRRQLTVECARQIEKLLAHNYRTRENTKRENGKTIHFKISPKPKLTDRIFAPYHEQEGNGARNLEYVYTNTAQAFRDTVDRLGIGYEEDGARRKVTLHTMRRYCYTTCIRKLGEGYAKYHTGRKVHEYDKRTPEQLAEDFAQVEPYLTFLDASGVEEKQEALVKEIAAIKKRLDRVDNLGDI